MKSLYHNFFKFPYLIIFTSIIITIVLGYFALNIGLETDINSLMPEKSEITKIMEEKLSIDDEITQYIFLSVESEDTFTISKLRALEIAIEKISSLPGISTAVNPFNFISFAYEGSRIIPVSMSPGGKAPNNAEDLEIFKRRLLDDPVADGFLVSDNGNVLNIVFSTGKIEDTDILIKEFYKIINSLKDNFSVHTTGEILVEMRTSFYLVRDLKILLVLALVIMVIVFFISFKTKRSIFLPIIVVGMGTIWTIGFMSLLGFDFTVVTVIIPSLLLTIGSSYTIHLLNEYYRTSTSNIYEDKLWIIKSVSHVTKTIILASLTTIIGFSTLVVTTIRPIQEFGVSISFGILSSAILSLFFLPAVLYILPVPHSKSEFIVKRGWLTSLTVKIGSIAINHKYIKDL